jgi:hypothetical protein
MSRCLACGRPLRRPSPSGFGPVCAERLGIPAPPSRRAATVRRPPAIRGTDTPPEIGPGQTALELIDHQPTLWSL